MHIFIASSAPLKSLLAETQERGVEVSWRFRLSCGEILPVAVQRVYIQARRSFFRFCQKGRGGGRRHIEIEKALVSREPDAFGRKRGKKLSIGIEVCPPIGVQY